VRSTGKFVKAIVTILLESVDPFMGGLSGDAETFCQFGYGVVFQIVVFEESLSLFSHGNTFPDPTSFMRKVLPMSLEFVLPMSLEFSVTYVLDWFTGSCYVCIIQEVFQVPLRTPLVR